MMNWALPCLLVALAGLCNSPRCVADWVGFRGCPLLGVGPDASLPVEWSKERNLAWVRTIPGWADSSPTVVGDRIYLTTQTEDEGLHVLALDRNGGEMVWSRQVGQGKLKSHDLHNMATPTPVSDGKRVWAWFGTGDLVCLDARGELVWRRQIQEDYGDYHLQWGMSTSPVLAEGRLYLAVMHSAPSYVLALDAGTGDELWKTPRDLGKQDESRDSYSTPIVVGSGDRLELIVSGANHINAYDPKTGVQRWIYGGLDVPHPYGRTIAGPTAGEDTIVTAASGFRNQGHLMAVRSGGQAENTSREGLWTLKRYAPDCPTPVIYQGKVYTVRDDGMASCVDLKTGHAHWQERVVSGDVKISPVAGDGKIYFLNGQANTTVIAAGEELKVLAQNDLDESTLSGLAISDGRIFIRAKHHLYAVQGR